MDQRQNDYNQWIFPYFKNKSISHIEEHHIKAWWSSIPETYKPSTRKRIMATMKGFLHFHRVTRVKMLIFPKITVPQKTPLWMTRDEQEKEFEFIPERHIPIFRFLQGYGCRSSESTDFEKIHIDWIKDLLTFTERKNDKDNTLPIIDEVRPYLRGGKISHWKYVFCTAEGQKYSRQILYRIHSDANLKAHKKYGIPIMPLKNATRHSKANQLLAEGKSIPYVARWLGNSPLVIARNYGTISIETLREDCATKVLPSSK